MRLAVCEWQKLFRLPALWVFLGLCLAFNGLLLAEPSPYDRAFFNETSSDAVALGQRADDSFRARLAALPYTENREILRQSLMRTEDIFETYSTEELAAFYQKATAGDPIAQSILTRKYELLQNRADHLAQTDAALDLYAGPITHDSHQYLYNRLLRAIVTEGILLGVLCTLYLMGCEKQTGTQNLICTSRTGRRLWRRKMRISLAASLGFYALLAAAALGPYLFLWNYDGIWNSSVSSQFNYYSDLFFVRPFLTWTDLTVKQYFIAMILAGGVLVLVFTMLTAAVGLWLKHTYAAAVAVTALCSVSVGLSIAASNSGWWTAYLLLTFSPVSLWLSFNCWFTEMGLSAAIPWQETVGLSLGLFVWGGLTAFTLRSFERKEDVS